MPTEEGQPAAGHDRRLGVGDRAVLVLLAAVYLAHQVVWPALHLPGLTGDVANYLAAARSLAAGGSPFAVHAFLHPPLLAFLMLPLAGLDPAVARWLWFTVGQLALLAAAWGTWRAAGGGRAAALAVTATWSLGGTAAVNLAIGQQTPLLLAALATALALLARHPATAAAWVGVATALKLWPGLLLAAWLPRPRWRGLAIGVGVAVLLIVGPVAWLATSGRAPALPASSGYWAGTPAPANVSLPAAVLRLLDRPEAGGELPLTWTSGDSAAALLPVAWKRAVAVAVGGLFLVLAVAGLLRPTLAGRHPGVLAVAALASVAVTVSPIAWYHYQLAHFPAIALLAAVYLRDRRWRALAGFAALGLLATHPEWLGFGRYAARHGMTAADLPALYFATTVGTAASLALVAWLVVAVRRGEGEGDWRTAAGTGRRATASPSMVPR